jgi:hypothetical protein
MLADRERQVELALAAAAMPAQLRADLHRPVADHLGRLHGFAGRPACLDR